MLWYGHLGNFTFGLLWYTKISNNHVANWEISTISPIFGLLAIKAKAIWEILIFSNKNPPFNKNSFFKTGYVLIHQLIVYTQIQCEQVH